MEPKQAIARNFQQTVKLLFQNRTTCRPMIIAASAITPSAVARIETPKLATMRLLIVAKLSPCRKATKASEQGSLRYHFASALVSR